MTMAVHLVVHQLVQMLVARAVLLDVIRVAIPLVQDAVIIHVKGLAERLAEEGVTILAIQHVWGHVDIPLISNCTRKLTTKYPPIYGVLCCLEAL